MGVKVAATCLHWSQPVVAHSPSSFQTLASAISAVSSPSKRRKGSDQALVWRFVQQTNRSALFGTKSSKLLRSRSCDNPPKLGLQTLRRACSDSFDGFSDEEFVEQIQELALRFHFADDDDNNNATDTESEIFVDSSDKEGESSTSSCVNGDLSKLDGCTSSVQNPGQFPPLKPEHLELPLLGIHQEPPDWPERDEIILSSIERKANSIDLPFSLRIIKRKKQWQEGFREAGESAYCSVKKAFSSMVFIIRELQSYALQMREFLFYEDLQEILVRVRKEMHASFVWLFQQVFSHTPTLMVYVMILLANFTVYSLASNSAIAAPLPPESFAALTETVSVTENQQWPKKFDSSAIKTFTVSSSVGKTSSINGGNNGGGGKVRPIASGTDGGENRSSSNHHRTILPDEISRVSSFASQTRTNKDELESESVSRHLKNEEELKQWNLIEEEALTMQAALIDESLDHETMVRLVSPVSVKVEPEDYTVHFKTELLYQMALSQEPSNPLLLSNYAQFLNLVVHDHDRAEEYFRRAIRVEPPDAESFDRYASFLWLVRKDLTAAEDTYLEAIAADPGNTYYAANYAHFLWSTGGEDTCYPLNSPDNNVA